jgi:hypothetical protein
MAYPERPLEFFQDLFGGIIPTCKLLDAFYVPPILKTMKYVLEFKDSLRITAAGLVMLSILMVASTSLPSSLLVLYARVGLRSHYQT